MASQSGLAGAGANGAFTITGLASTANLVVGMAASGTNVASGAVIASIDSATQVTVSKAHTGVVTSGTIAFTPDTFNIVLIKSAASTTYDKGFTNLGTPGSGAPSTSNIGTDEQAASGTYAAGGSALAANVNPSVTNNVALTNWTTNPSWTGATLSVIGCAIGNQSGARLGSTTKRSVSLHDFGGTQAVTAGTMTLTLPTANDTLAILRIA